MKLADYKVGYLTELRYCTKTTSDEVALAFDYDNGSGDVDS